MYTNQIKSNFCDRDFILIESSFILIFMCVMNISLFCDRALTFLILSSTKFLTKSRVNISIKWKNS